MIFFRHAVCFCVIAAQSSERKACGESCAPVQQEGCLPRTRRDPTEKKRKVRGDEEEDRQTEIAWHSGDIRVT